VLLGHVGQHAQHGQPDQETIRRRPGAEAERGPQRLALRAREPIQAVQHRCQQLVQPRVGELHLRLDTRGARHPAARGVLDQVVQQRRLAHPRLTADHQRPALTSANGVDEPVQHLRFAVSTPQLRGIPPPAGGSPSARHRHYADASMGGLGACTRKQPFATRTSDQHKRNAPTLERPPPGHTLNEQVK
jgi:hypothetical protein